MQLSEQTLMVLNNFKTIQPNVMFRKGNVIRTMAEAKNVIASANLDIEITSEFGIFDLNEFLATLNLVDNPELDIQDKFAVVRSKSNRSRIKYFFSDESMLTYPQNEIKMPSTDVSFTFDSNTLNQVKKASSTLGIDMLTMEVNDGTITLSVVDPKDNTSNMFSIDVAANSETDEPYKFIINLNNLKLLPVDYDVNISKKFISHFTSRDPNVPVEYWIALEKDSQ